MVHPYSELPWPPTRTWTAPSRSSSWTRTARTSSTPPSLTVIEEQTRLPTTATLLGTPVTVTAFDHTDDRGIIARCEGPDGTGEISLADLAFPPETVTAWVHAAYRHWLGLQPFRAAPRPGWTWPD